MILEDIVESINRYIEDRRLHEGLNTARGHLVLHKSITPAPLAKAYKVYEYTLWLIRTPHQYRVFTLKQQERVLAGMEEEFTRVFERHFFEGLLKLIIDGKGFNSDKSTLEEIIHGEYTGNGNE